MSALRFAAVVAAALLLGACGTPPPHAPLTIVAAGDIADCTRVGAAGSGAARTAALVEPTDAFVLTLGDNTYPDGAPGEFADCFEPTWGRFGARLRPAPGNHDYRTAGAAGYFEYFGDRAGPARRGYYAFSVGGWHVLSLNSHVDATAGSPQHRWLLQELAQSDALCTLAVWHHPVFSSGPHGDDPRMRDALAALHAAGAEIVLVAHDHVYERLVPHDAAGAPDPVRGVRSFTVGTGGARLYRFRQPHPLSAARDASAHGLLRLQLRADGYRWEFVSVGGGAPRDNGEDACRR